ncbi:phosphoenolpyruvate carboxylase, partial [Escherichia coli]
YHSISPHGEAASNPVALAKLIERLKDKNFTNQQLKQAVEQISIELVLTAHPTEIARRTLIHKLVEVNTCLSQLD